MHRSRVLVRAIAASAAIAVVASAWAQESRTLDASGPIPYFIAAGSPATGYRPSDRQLSIWALNQWQNAAALKLEPASESNAIVRLYWAEANESQYGEMRPLAVGGRRGAAVFIRPDVEALGPDIAQRARADALFRDTIVYLTCLHELGHAFGMSHTADFRDIMYFFGYGGDILEYFDRYRRQLRTRDDIARVSGLSQDDTDRIRKLYRR